jgi:hypothetical protein
LANKEITDIFTTGIHNFEQNALWVFSYQYEHNILYRKFCDTLQRNPGNVKLLGDIPFLPISFFKTHTVVSGTFLPEVEFESSGTTGSVNSIHQLKDSSIYVHSFMKAFRQFYGDPAGYCILGLLPSYLERKRSSLVYMVNELIKQSHNPGSGFYLYDHVQLKNVLEENENKAEKSLVIGVTYALLDFAEEFKMDLCHTIIMETGGMKGRRDEITRPEVHAKLRERLGITEVHSEYGMTELLSQAYSKKEGRFETPPWMKVLVRAEDDPFQLTFLPETGSAARAGVINIIDLANLYSCSFIATDDIGKLYPDGSFEVLGRLDNSDVRGCGLMLT